MPLDEARAALRDTRDELKAQRKALDRELSAVEKALGELELQPRNTSRAKSSPKQRWRPIGAARLEELEAAVSHRNKGFTAKDLAEEFNITLPAAQWAIRELRSTKKIKTAGRRPDRSVEYVGADGSS